MPLDALKGFVSFEGVTAGSYLIEFRYFDLPRLTQRVTVLPRERTDVDRQLKYFSYFGKVKRGGKPVKAHLFETISDAETGEYVAVLDRMPSSPTAHVVAPCDGSPTYRFVPDPVPVENTRYDVDIPENRILIDVVDTRTGAPVPQASINMAAMIPGQKEGAPHWAGGAGKTDERGQFVITPVIVNRVLNICARHQDYEPGCADPFTGRGVVFE